MDIFNRLFDIYDLECEKDLKANLLDSSLSHLTFNHYEYLNHIALLGTPTLSELADELSISKPSVTVMVNKLMKEDLVEKFQSDNDKRVFHVKLSDKGLMMTVLERQAFMRVTQMMMDKLDEKDQKTLTQLLEKALG